MKITPNYLSSMKGFFMKKGKKVSITYYISCRFIGIIVIMYIIIIFFITYFPNQTILRDIRHQIRQESRYDFLNIDIKNEKLIIGKNFIFKENHIQKIILDDSGKQLYGSYPIKDLENYPINNKKKFRQVKTSDGYYYIFDRRIIKSDLVTKKRTLFTLRSVGKKSDFTSEYQALKYVAYVFICFLTLVAIVLIRIVSFKLTIPMKEIKSIADKIGTAADLTKRIDYAAPFKELDSMICANNRMIDRIEDLFNQQKQFTSDVAHELRTPTSVILAECQYLKKYGRTIDDYKEALDAIERQSSATNEIINQLLQLSRLDQGRIKTNFEYANFKLLIESICESDPLCEQKKITIHQNLENISIYMNVGLMSIAIKNLVNNSLKYSPDYSPVELRLWKTGEKIFFEIEDYGCGMNEEVQKHIYDRFYRADKSRNTEGFGLGLSLVHKIIELHKGTIRVQSELGVGSIFTLSLPSDKSPQQLN